MWNGEHFLGSNSYLDIYLPLSINISLYILPVYKHGELNIRKNEHSEKDNYNQS